jgi:electron transfer flavoprotein alpha subunit
MNLGIETEKSRAVPGLPQHMIVCVKQVPEMAELKFDHCTKTVIRDGVRNILNPFDRRALAQAVQLAAMGGGTVTVITMGPPQAREALIECLAAGADRAVHLMDKTFAGSDTLATAQALAVAIRKIGFDLIFCGRESIDAETGQVGPELAELLGIPHVTAACVVNFDGKPDHFIVERETDEGIETIECKLPALITAAERLIKPIKVKEEEIESANQKSVEVITATDLSSDASAFGTAGSPTSVSEIIHLEISRKAVMMEGTIEQMADGLVERLFLPNSLSRRPFPGRRPGPSLEKDGHPIGGKSVLVLAELIGGKLRDISLELIGKGGELAARMQAELATLIIGGEFLDCGSTLAAYGADRVYLAKGERFARYNPLHYATALTEAIVRLKPHIVLIPSTTNGRDYAPRVAARLKLGLTADCVGLELNEAGQLIQLKPAFGGQIVARILSTTWPQMATVRPGVFEVPEPDWTRLCPVEPLEVVRVDDDRYRVLASSRDAGRASADLDDADVIVCAGMGVGGQENIPQLELLARSASRALTGVNGGRGGKAAIGATRRVADAGWLPRQQQIGLTGRTVSPRLYIAVGVRGNFNHTIGIRRSEIIVAINTDPAAEIFRAADFGVVADWALFVPALTEAFNHKSERTAEFAATRPLT